MRCSNFHADSDSFITYTPLSLLTSTGSDMYIQFHRTKAMKRNALAKQIDSFKIKFDKNVILITYL